MEPGNKKFGDPMREKVKDGASEGKIVSVLKG